MSDPSTEDPKLLYSKVQESFADDAQMLDCFSAFHASFLENLQCDNLKRNASGRALRWLSATEALSEQYAKPGGSRADKLSSSYETRRYLVAGFTALKSCLETAGLLDTSSPSSARAINVRAITKEQVQELVEQHQEQASALLLSVKDKETDLSTEYACKAAIIAAAAPVPAPATLSFSQLYAVVWRGRYLLRSIIPAAARYTQAQRQCMQLAEEKDASANAGSTADADADAAVFAEYTEAVQGTHASLLQSLQAAMNDRARDAAVSLLSSVSQRLDALKKTLPSGAYDVDIKDEEVYDTAVAVIEVSDTVLGTKDSKEAALIGQIDQAVCLLEAIDMLQSSSSPSSPSPPPATAAAAVSSVSSSQSLQTSLALSEESAQALRALGVLAREVVGPLCKLLKNKMEAPTREWKNAFTSISGQQTRELTCGPAGAEIKKNKMSVLFVSWSDVGRSYMSCGGSNITDMQFFAMPPAEMRPYCKDYRQIPKNLMVNFPAVRSANFTDEVDIRDCSSYMVNVRSYTGQVRRITLQSFLKHIGQYITDLDPSEDWSDPIDGQKGKMQVASQFSVLPIVERLQLGKCDLGISAYGYQRKNLHVIIGPDGEIGWAPEGRGYKTIFFRDNAGTRDSLVQALTSGCRYPTDIANIISRYCLGKGQSLHTVALVPENRKEVKASFFKAPVQNESLAEEAKRYAKTENKLIHIQISMVRQEAKRSTAGAGGDAEAIDTEPVSAVRLTDAHSGLLRAQEQEELRLTALQNTATGTAARSVTMPCQVRMRENLYASRSLASSKGLHCIQQMCRNAAGGRKSEGASQSAKRKQMDDGLNLARVGLGDDVGRAGLGDMVPGGAVREAGSAVRVTEMFYAVAKDTAFTKQRINRFMQQMSFARRAQGHAHGSLVTGKGSWGSSAQDAPITLQKKGFRNLWGLLA